MQSNEAKVQKPSMIIKTLLPMIELQNFIETCVG